VADIDRDKNNLIDLAERRQVQEAARREREQAVRNDEDDRHLLAYAAELFREPLFPEGDDAA
jgi:hypothetical protein